MHSLRRYALVALALILACLSSSCTGLLWHNRPIGWRKNLKNLKTAPGFSPTLMMATRDQLNQRIVTYYNAVNSFQATVDMTPSIGSVYKGQITEIKDIRAFVLFRKPSDIRIIGQLPVVRSNAFDMVSHAGRFSFFLNSKNLFFEGANDAPAVSENRMENLRPEAFLSSMVIRPADLSVESILIEDSTDEDTAIYELLFVRKTSAGELYLYRNVWFDRLDLSMIRQKVLDEKGLIVSDTRYSKWQPYNGVSFPAHIDINRPKDGYGVSMEVLQMQMNKTMTNEQFVLNRPEGSQLREIGASSTSSPKEPRH